MREHFVVSSIRSREVAPAGRSGVRHDEDALKALDFENSLLSASMPSQYPTWLWQSSNGGASAVRACENVPLPSRNELS
jgi:hypothetical protein